MRSLSLVGRMAVGGHRAKEDDWQSSVAPAGLCCPAGSLPLGLAASITERWAGPGAHDPGGGLATVPTSWTH